MSRIEMFSFERRGNQGSLAEWTDALTSRIGRTPPSVRLTTCQTVGRAEFVGRIEHGGVREITLARVTTTTPHYLMMGQRDLSLHPRTTALWFQTVGACRVQQGRHPSILYPGDWCVLDMRDRLRIDALDAQNEHLALHLRCVPDSETLSLLSNATARRWSTTTGASRILRATVTETFDQLNRLSDLANGGLERAITELVWQAIREQVEVPISAPHQDLQCAWAKRLIESRIHDSHLSIDAIAEGCGMSVRSLHRAFSGDSAGSVSKYLWTRRLDHCAAALRDPRQRSVTEICFAWGFNSTSHFSRIFKERFGVTPSEYRASKTPFESRLTRGLSWSQTDG